MLSRSLLILFLILPLLTMADDDFKVATVIKAELLASTAAAAPTDRVSDQPVSHVTHDCVDCGLCGEMAHAAVLCPSFYRAARIHNPGLWDRLVHRMRRTVIGWLARTV